MSDLIFDMIILMDRQASIHDANKLTSAKGIGIAKNYELKRFRKWTTATCMF